MATYEENFVVTAIPAGITPEGKLRLTVMVAPRLVFTGTSDGGNPRADNWPDAQKWPETEITNWKVTINAGTDHVFEGDAVDEVSGPYEASAWQSMFPEDQGTIPFNPDRQDRSGIPIQSYSVAAIRDAVKAMHVDVLKDSRTEFPTVAYLEGTEVFKKLKEAARNPQVAVPTTAPTDAAMGLLGALQAAENSLGVQPGSLGLPPTVTAVSPSSGFTYGGQPVTITGTNFLPGVTVKFGTLSANQVVVVNSTTITCLTPSTEKVEGEFQVRVTTAIGTSPESPAVMFTYSRPPAPDLTGPASPVAFGNGGPGTVTLFGTNLQHRPSVFVYMDYPIGEPDRTLPGTQVVITETGLTFTVPEFPRYPDPAPPGQPPINPSELSGTITVVTDGGEDSVPFTLFEDGPA